MPEPSGDLGVGPRLVHHRAVQRACVFPRRDRFGRMRERGTRGLPLVPRWIDCNRVTLSTGWATRRSTCSARSTSWAWTGPAVRVRRGGLATRRGGSVPAGSGDARRPHDRQDVRGNVGDGSAGRRPPPGLPVSRGRHRGDVGARRGAGGRVTAAINPVIALELTNGTWSGAASWDRRRRSPGTFLDLLNVTIAVGHGGTHALLSARPVGTARWDCPRGPRSRPVGRRGRHDVVAEPDACVGAASPPPRCRRP